MGRLRSIHERSSRCNLFTAPASPVKVAQPAHSVCCCVPGWAPQVRATTVGRARGASRFTVAPLNFRRKAASISVQSRLPVEAAVLGRGARTDHLWNRSLSPATGNRAQGVHSARAIRVAGRQGRAQSFRGRMAMLGLYVPTRAPWYPELRAELLSFPAGKFSAPRQ
jgi:hypothetical protein